MLTLFENARAMDIMGTVCAALLRSSGPNQKPRVQTRRKCEKIRNYITVRLSDPLTIERVARDTGVSVSWVQRHFREEFGVSVFEFIRPRRLEAGRLALEREDATIAQAAFVAGYSGPTSFAVAFRKAF